MNNLIILVVFLTSIPLSAATRIYCWNPSDVNSLASYSPSIKTVLNQSLDSSNLVSGSGVVSFTVTTFVTKGEQFDTPIKNVQSEECIASITNENYILKLRSLSCSANYMTNGGFAYKLDIFARPNGGYDILETMNMAGAHGKWIKLLPTQKTLEMEICEVSSVAKNEGLK